jgi:starch phosphorylase
MSTERTSRSGIRSAKTVLIEAPKLDLSVRSIAYFSMEIALSPALPTYSGGLGMLAGDTLRSAADTGAPMVAVSLVHRRGYFRQKLDANGQQTEFDVPWSPETTLAYAGEVVTLTMQGRKIKVCAWRFDVVGVKGHIIPVYLLDTDIDGNDPYDRKLTNHLYGGDTYYRLCQETVLGLGGIHLLHKLGCMPAVCHMNEGHAALLALGLLEDRLEGNQSLADTNETDRLGVAKQCVFTTHTPVTSAPGRWRSSAACTMAC